MHNVLPLQALLLQALLLQALLLDVLLVLLLLRVNAFVLLQKACCMRLGIALWRRWRRQIFA